MSPCCVAGGCCGHRPWAACFGMFGFLDVLRPVLSDGSGSRSLYSWLRKLNRLHNRCAVRVRSISTNRSGLGTQIPRRRSGGATAAGRVGGIFRRDASDAAAAWAAASDIHRTAGTPHLPRDTALKNLNISSACTHSRSKSASAIDLIRRSRSVTCFTTGKVSPARLPWRCSSP